MSLHSQLGNKFPNPIFIVYKNPINIGSKKEEKRIRNLAVQLMSRMTNLVSVTKKRSITLPSGAVDTFTLFIVSSSSQRASVISVENK